MRIGTSIASDRTTSVINELSSIFKFTVPGIIGPVSLDGDKRPSDWPMRRSKFELWDLRAKLRYGSDPICRVPDELKLFFFYWSSI